MLTLILGLILFNGLHLVPASPSLRTGIRDRLGPLPYMLLFSLLSIAGLVLMVRGYGEAHGLGRGNIQLWSPPAFLRHITLALMLPAFILLAAAYIPSRIRTAAKHPMLAAVKIWALAHLLVRGDLASVLLFGSLLAFGVFDRISVKKRGAMGPLGAASGGMAGDVMAIAVGSLAYAAMVFWGHSALIGVPLLR